jgi:hypothetical protein
VELLHCAHRHQEEYLGVTEPQRLALHAAARATLGEEEGDTLMALSPPANTDIATRQDVQHAEERLDARMQALEERIDARIAAAVSAAEARLMRSIHAAELRTIGVIILAFLGTNLLG